MNSLVPAWTGAPELVIDPAMEKVRVEELHSLRMLDTPRERRFDRITALAAEFFQAPIAFVGFLDEKYQWLKSVTGPLDEKMPRCMSFCQYTINQERPLVIHDALEHPIGQNHPWVVGPPNVRFYAGVPLNGPTKKKIGTFCVLDFKPREFSGNELSALVSFAKMVEREINLGDIIDALMQTRHRLVEARQELDNEFADAARYVRQMLPPPLHRREIVDWHFHPCSRLGGDGLGYRRIDDDQLAIYILDVTGHGLGSTLLAVTVLELLRNSSVQIDFSKPAVVVERLNRTFQMQEHSGKFFSAWYGVYSHSRQEITYASAGHPPALLLTRDHGRLHLERTAPGTSVLGITTEINPPEITIPFARTSELILFTDGLYELLDPNGGRGSYDEFFAYLQTKTAAGQEPWPTLQRWHIAAQKDNRIDDDVSMLRFALPQSCARSND